MRSTIASIALPILLAIAGCASPAPQASAGATFIVVRHAEKSTDDPKDPSLSEAGRARANALARQFEGRPLAAAYATGFKRTQQTALPAASASGIGVTLYDASIPAVDFVGALRRVHAQGTILVVGHSNTVPDIVAALCGCPVAPLGDSDYGRLYEVRIDHTKRATLVERNY